MQIRAEDEMVFWFRKHKNGLFFLMINIFGILVRCSGISFLSGDMQAFLLPWFNSMKNVGGGAALECQIGDYNVLYQTIIALITYIDCDPVFMYKCISILFDYTLAASTAWFVSKITNNKIFEIQFNIIYGAVLFLPTVLLNSSYWGQCDSIYTTFLILTLFFIYDEKYVCAFIMLGLGFAFKLQMIFIVPFIICYYFCTQKFSILHICISIITFWLTGIIAFINGRNLLAPFTIYASQTTTYEHMYMNSPSFWLIVGDDYNSLKSFSIIFTMVLLGTGMYIMLSKKIIMDTLEDYISIAAGFVWTCLMFLPAMHERYSYPLDILLLILGTLNKKYLIYAVVSVMLSIITYGHYLFGTERITQYHAILYILIYIKYIGTLLNNNTKDQKGEI